jgi:2-polyprenyl-6-methoxyphenol hydroxylase-like FAD-dependent oxidoreductase
MRVLGALGLAERLEAQGAVGEGFWFLNSAGETLSRFKIQGRPVMVLRSVLHQALVEAARREGVDVEYGWRLESIENGETRVRARSTEGASAEADLLVGFDGTHSRVRALVMPEQAEARALNTIAVGGFVASEEAVSPAHARYINLIVGPQYQFGFAATDPAAQRWAWWSHLHHPDAGSRERSARVDAEALRNLLLASFGDWWGPARSLILRSPTVLRTAVFDVPSLKRWWSGRVVLAGDAAHAMSPTGGQGVSMALEDAQLLSGLLSTDQPLEAILRVYEKQRRARVEPIIAQAKTNSDRVLGKLGPAGEWLRDRFLGALGPVMARGLNRQYAFSLGSPPASPEAGGG